MTPTIFYGLFQGDYSDYEGDSTCIAVFSSEERAQAFEKLISDEHTDLKRQVNDAHNDFKNDQAVLDKLPYVPDLYWDIRPLALDPESLPALEAAE